MVVDWRQKHFTTMLDFVNYINKVSKSFVLKGGTALMFCYSLNRFSEDIDLDGFNTDIEKIVKEFCRLNKYGYRVAKNTRTVKRFMINYGAERKPLKVEVSYRLKNIDFESTTTTIKGILVYDIHNILTLKLIAYINRDKIRDLYDVVYMSLKYWDVLTEQLKIMIRNALAYKGIGNLDYLLSTQKDELIDKAEMEKMFLSLWLKLELK